MYLGIDFLITPELELHLVEVNVGLPGGAHEYHLTHGVYFGKPSDIFQRIESTSQKVYGKTFKDYLHSLPFIDSLKPFKIWMDGMGPFPGTFHPGLRLEDKWNQYQLLKAIAPMPETMILSPDDTAGVEQFIERKKKVVLKRRVGRGGKGLQIITGPSSLWKLNLVSNPFLLQEHIESKIDGFSLSVRSVAFGGEFMCMYANLSTRPNSNHGILTFISPGNPFGLSEKNFKTESFNQKSWEAEIWFGRDEPQYLRHNLYEEVVAKTTLLIPEPLLEKIKELSIKIERTYDGLDLFSLPKSCFEE
jgi:ATP-grasp domain